jgi:hypothetical protein
MTNELRNGGTLSSDVLALCTLLAHILRRAIVEQDARIMELVPLPSSSMSEKKEVKDI